MRQADRLQETIARSLGGDGSVFVRDLTVGQRRGGAALLERVQSGGLSETARDFGRFQIWYTADADPDASTPAWTETAEGTITHGASGGVFDLADTVDADSLLYAVPVPELDNTDGTEVSCRVKVTAGSTAVNRGFALGIHDGTRQFVVWLRPAGLNIDNEAQVAFTLSEWCEVRFVAVGDRCRVAVNGGWVQTGSWMHSSAKTQITFGTTHDAP